MVAFKGRPSGIEIVDDPEWGQAKVEVPQGAEGTGSIGQAYPAAEGRGRAQAREDYTPRVHGG
jgi:hypothetical protein